MLNCTISTNSAGKSGGGLYVSGISGDGPLVISHCTVVDNYAHYSGGGIGGSFSRDDVFLDHVILAGNRRNQEVADDTDGYLTANWSIIGHPKYETFGEHNLIGVDPLLGPLQNNGGLTETHALLAGSPAINAGDPTFVPPPYSDQRGYGYSRKVDGRIDIGAYEAQTALVVADFDADGDADGRDFLAWQRNPSVGSLSDWREQYGAGEPLAVSSQLLATEESQELRVESGEPESTADPGNAVPGLGLLGVERPAIESDRGFGEIVIDDAYVDQVDRAVEALVATPRFGVREFGEMVTRRGVRQYRTAR
jgi:hypothetical protein